MTAHRDLICCARMTSLLHDPDVVMRGYRRVRVLARPRVDETITDGQTDSAALYVAEGVSPVVEGSGGASVGATNWRRCRRRRGLQLIELVNSWK